MRKRLILCSFFVFSANDDARKLQAIGNHAGRALARTVDAQKQGVCAQIGGFCAIYLAVCAKKRTFAADF